MTDYQTCTWGSCDRPVKAGELCSAHYQRRRDGRNMDAPFKGNQRTCSQLGCNREHHAGGYCTAHYQRLVRGQDMAAPLDAPPRTCSHPGCERPHSSQGYCSAHYQRKFLLHSDMDAPIRKRRRKGEPLAECIWEGCTRLRRYPEYCPLHQKRFLEDRPMDGPAYYHESRGWLTDKGYRRIPVGNGKSRFEHRVVMEQILERPLLRQEEVHHKNGIKSDNSPGNLELWVSWKGQRVEDLVVFVITNYRGELLERLRGA